MPRMPRHFHSTTDSSRREADLLQGTLDMLILKVVALEPIHGYAIVQRIQQISRQTLHIRQGSLYPALYRLENRGLLTSEWRTNESGREAKYYSLTKLGQNYFDEEKASWRRLCESISLVLDAGS
jgi:PadR family transcriptional regulator, regulatory protein PadR